MIHCKFLYSAKSVTLTLNHPTELPKNPFLSAIHCCLVEAKQLHKNQYFEGAPPEVWEFHIGGYQVCDKWLKDRRDRQLSYADLTHYQQIIVALKETLRLMREIDAAITEWPIQ